MNENEISTKRNLMVNIDGVLVPRLYPLKRHNKNAPKTIKGRMDTMKQTNEDSDSRAMRSNEYSLHTNNAAPPLKKFRVLSKATKATVSKHDSMADAMTAHSKHPDRKKLYVENAPLDKHELVKSLMEKHQEFPAPAEKATLKFSEYREIYEEQESLIESQIEEKKQLLLDKKKVVNEIEFDGSNKAIKENAFDWKGTKSSIVWNDKKNNNSDFDAPEHKEVKAPAEKKKVGRPAGKYGSYKVDRSAADKKAIADKVHGNPERKAKYDDAIAARREFKSLMTNAIKAKESKSK